MEISVAKQDGVPIALCKGALDIQVIKESKEKILEFTASNPNVPFDLSAVEEIDTAGIQLLLSLRKDTQEHGQVLVLKNPSDPMKEVLKLLHIVDLCEEPLIHSR